ncbi:MAG: DUF3516 domain-containing protein [Corynebacterium sp.]|nr:DUF3516 domain-containing protein [Corynebacterium sp.]
MTLTQLLPDLKDVPESLFDESIYDSFQRWVEDRGITLYPAQEEASLGVLAGDNVILSTPTGSGKSMVAIAAHFIAMARGQRSFYTAPIKALVSEKFFALCEIFGPEAVGMMTGDASVNTKAPIICATAEIVANIALAEGPDSRVDQVVMDEFHYYSDPERGWAWQVPLLELPKTQFLLMSATLGDTDFLRKDLEARTGRGTTLVTGVERPVPLEFSYVYTTVEETLEELIKKDLAPVYVVHPSQRLASERATGLQNTPLANSLLSREEKDQIAEAIGDFRFTTTFGKTLSRLLRKGIGIHHAGMLPKYRRLVERLAQTGLLKIICGTDTLGIGINVPIRTVLITSLTKFDGNGERVLKSREFHQIAGRAGRAGYDTKGTVVIEAPDHEIENFKLRKRAGQDEKKLKKLRMKAAPKGRPTWTEKTFERLIEAEPEKLTSQFKFSNAMLLNMLARPSSGPEETYENIKHLLRTNHNTRSRQNKDILTAIELYRGLEALGIVKDHALAHGLPEGFALNQPLAPFAVAALELLDTEDPQFHLNVVSVIESVLEAPNQVLRAQQAKARQEERQHLKDEGVDYTEQLRILDEVTWPKPLNDLLTEAHESYAEGHPWAKDYDIDPKSIVREMIERGMTFSDYTSEYGLARAEGVLLRYLTEAWRTLNQTVPDEFFNEQLEDIGIWLGELIRQVDSSLLDEWAQMADPDAPISQETVDREVAFGVTDPDALSANKRAFGIMIRNLMFRLVDLFAWEKEDDLDAAVDYLDERPDWGAAMDDYFDEYTDVDLGPDARGPQYFTVESESADEWVVRQIIKDPKDDKAFAFVATIDVPESDRAGEVRFKSLSIQY